MSVYISAINWGPIAYTALILYTVAASCLVWRSIKRLNRRFSLGTIHGEIDQACATDFAVDICDGLRKNMEKTSNISSGQTQAAVSVYDAVCERSRGLDTQVNLPQKLVNAIRAFIRLSEKIHNERFISNTDRDSLFKKLCTGQEHIGTLIHYAEGAQNISGKEIRFLKIMEKTYGIYRKCGVSEESYYRMNITPPALPHEQKKKPALLRV